MFEYFKTKVIFMKTGVWIFCIRIAFGHVKEQNGF